jgi:hypothetical protein
MPLAALTEAPLEAKTADVRTAKSACVLKPSRPSSSCSVLPPAVAPATAIESAPATTSGDRTTLCAGFAWQRFAKRLKPKRESAAELAAVDALQAPTAPLIKAAIVYAV